MRKSSDDDGGLGCIATLLAFFCIFYICSTLAEIRSEVRAIREGMHFEIPAETPAANR